MNGYDDTTTAGAAKRDADSAEYQRRRDRFELAKAAMQGILANPNECAAVKEISIAENVVTGLAIARRSVRVADHSLDELSK